MLLTLQRLLLSMGPKNSAHYADKQVLIVKRLVCSKICSGGPRTAQYMEVLIYRGFTIVLKKVLFAKTQVFSCIFLSMLFYVIFIKELVNGG